MDQQVEGTYRIEQVRDTLLYVLSGTASGQSSTVRDI